MKVVLALFWPAVVLVGISWILSVLVFKLYYGRSRAPISLRLISFWGFLSIPCVLGGLVSDTCTDQH